MAYQEITNYNSPNYSAGRQGRSIEYIVIHHWGNPADNPQFDGVCAWLCNPSAQVSAHAVVQAGRVAYLVNDSDTAWCNGTFEANLRGIGIECNPQCSDGDYETIAELVSDYWKAHGRVIPLKRHSDFVATQCPGNYNLTRIYDMAMAYYNGKPEPTPNKKVPEATRLGKPRLLKTRLAKTELWDLETNPDYKSVKTFPKGTEIEFVGKIEFNDATYFQTEYSFGKNKWGVNSNDVEKIKPEIPTPETTAPETPTPETPETPEPNYAKENSSTLKRILDIVNGIWELLTGIFKR